MIAWIWIFPTAIAPQAKHFRSLHVSTSNTNFSTVAWKKILEHFLWNVFSNSFWSQHFWETFQFICRNCFIKQVHTYIHCGRLFWTANIHLPSLPHAPWEEYPSQPSYGFGQMTFFANGTWVNTIHIMSWQKLLLELQISMICWASALHHEENCPKWLLLPRGSQNERIHGTDLNPVHSLEPRPAELCRAEQSYNQPVNTWVGNKCCKPLEFGGSLLLQEKLTDIHLRCFWKAFKRM